MATLNDETTVRKDHPARVVSGSSRALGRCASKVFAEVCGVRLPSDTATRLARSLNAAATADDARAALDNADLMLVSESSLRRFGVNDAPRVIALLRQRRGILGDTVVPGVWQVLSDKGCVPPDGFLGPLMHVNPHSLASLGPGALPEETGAVKREYGYTYNVPPSEQVPGFMRTLARPPTRWEPRAPFWMADSRPVFAPVTELAYIAAHPDDRFYPLEDAIEFLDDVCVDIDAEEMCREIDGASAATWLRVGCLLAAAGRDELTRNLAEAASSRADDAATSPDDRVANETFLRRTRAWRPKQPGVTETLRASIEPAADLRSLLRDVGTLNSQLRSEASRRYEQRVRDRRARARA